MKAKVIQVKHNQTLVDIALQEYGVFEGIFLVLFANIDTISSITQELVPGQQLKIWNAELTRQVVEKEEELVDYMPSLINLFGSLLGNMGASENNDGDDGDYVHIRGDEVVQGVKTFITGIKTETIDEINDGGITIEGITIKDGELDAGEF